MIVGLLGIAVSRLFIQRHLQFCPLSICLLQFLLICFERNLFVEGNKVVVDSFFVVLDELPFGGKFRVITGNDFAQLFECFAPVAQGSFLIVDSSDKHIYLALLLCILTSDLILHLSYGFLRSGSLTAFLDISHERYCCSNDGSCSQCPRIGEHGGIKQFHSGISAGDIAGHSVISDRRCQNCHTMHVHSSRFNGD